MQTRELKNQRSLKKKQRNSSAFRSPELSQTGASSQDLGTLIAKARSYLRLRQYEDCARLKESVAQLISTDADMRSSQDLAVTQRGREESVKTQIQAVALGIWVSHALMYLAEYEHCAALLKRLGATVRDLLRGLQLTEEHTMLEGLPLRRLKKQLDWITYLKIFNKYLWVDRPDAREASGQLLLAKAKKFICEIKPANYILPPGLNAVEAESQEPFLVMTNSVRSAQQLLKLLRSTFLWLMIARSTRWSPENEDEAKNALNLAEQLLAQGTTASPRILTHKLQAELQRQVSVQQIETLIYLKAPHHDLMTALHSQVFSQAGVEGAPAEPERSQGKLSGQSPVQFSLADTDCMFEMKSHLKFLLLRCEIAIAANNQKSYTSACEAVIRAVQELVRRTNRQLGVALLLDISQQLCNVAEFQLGKDKLAKQLILLQKRHQEEQQQSEASSERQLQHEPSQQRSFLEDLMTAQLYQMLKLPAKLRYASVYYRRVEDQMSALALHSNQMQYLPFLWEFVCSSLILLDDERSDQDQLLEKVKLARARSQHAEHGQLSA